MNVTDDNNRLTVSPQVMTVAEGIAYTVALDAKPSGPVTAMIASSDAAAVSRTPGALTFSTTNWQTAQAVVVMAVVDADAVDERVTLTHTLMEATEYTVRMGPPAVLVDAVVVRIGSNNAEVHAVPGPLQYTASDWDTPQVVTVTGVTAGQSVTLSHAMSGYGDVTTAASVKVTVVGTGAGILIDPRALMVLEGRVSATYKVRLRTEPGVAVTIFVNLNQTNSAVSQAPAALTFSATGSNTAPTVAAWTHAASGYSSVTSGPVAEVTEVEDTTPTLGMWGCRRTGRGRRRTCGCRGRWGAIRRCAIR